MTLQSLENRQLFDQRYILLILDHQQKVQNYNHLYIGQSKTSLEELKYIK